MRICSILAAGIALGVGPVAAAPEFRNAIVIPGGAADHLPTATPGANTNRLGGFLSDLWFDRRTNRYLALPDRGPGGGTIPYDARLQEFSVSVDHVTGAISAFQLTRTTPLLIDGQPYNGLNPRRLGGDAATLGRSLDPEGLVATRTGTLFVADEYGPSVLEFSPAGALLRSFPPPSNLLPRQADGQANYVDGRPAIVAGRQDNRGYEGLAISPDGSKLYGILQAPLVEEGGQSDGRRSRNVRIVEYDTASGQSGRQWIYQMDAIADLNAVTPGNPFSATNQGRSIGLSAIVALNATEFLVLERDGRGIGVDDPIGKVPVASKRIYRIDIAGATDVADISLAGLDTLPPGVSAVRKALFLDIAVALKAAGQPIPEKMEGLTIGPRLADGRYALLIGTDNDYSVTQNGTGTQFNVCADATRAEQVALEAACPAGLALIPTTLFSFQAD
ncbi:MAG: esterase-like activity of phytase family protein, partial [Gemmatimonadaceae bacterium]|nr:esterase-like activity of phytase family protein [Acetobacteraceae bacterium]